MPNILKPLKLQRFDGLLPLDLWFLRLIYNMLMNLLYQYPWYFISIVESLRSKKDSAQFYQGIMQYGRLSYLTPIVWFWGSFSKLYQRTLRFLAYSSVHEWRWTVFCIFDVIPSIFEFIKSCLFEKILQ